MKKTISILFIMAMAAGLGFGQTMSNPVLIAKTTSGVRWSQMAFTPDGTAHFVWEEHLATLGHGIVYASYNGQAASTPVSLGTTNDSYEARPGIAAGPQGKIVVVWGQDYSVLMRVYDPVQKKWLATEHVKDGYGGDEPLAAVDKDGNIYVWWYTDREGRVYSRAKVGGNWEETQRLSAPGTCKQGGIAIGKDGRVWAVWREKQGNGEYKLRYSKRTKSSLWSPLKDVNDAGGSSSHPAVTVGPDNTPWATQGDLDESSGHDQEMWVIKIDEQTNPRQLAIPLYAAHYPRIAIDNNGKVHLACAIGGGDYGDGVRYTNNISGTWKAPHVFGSVWPKVPRIAHDGYGNIAMCWTNMNQSGYTLINMSSLYPIAKVVFYPPTELAASMTFDPNDTTKFTYNFNWKANDQNVDRYMEGYRIFRKTGEVTEDLVTVAKTETTASLTLTTFDETAEFGVAAVGTSGAESEAAWFDIDYPQIYGPVNAVASITLAKLMSSPEVTASVSWAANPQNTDSYVKEYRIYMKEAGGNFVLLATVPKTQTSKSITITSKKKFQLGITTASVLNKESSMVLF